jgi:hypothetical protein
VPAARNRGDPGFGLRDGRPVYEHTAQHQSTVQGMNPAAPGVGISHLAFTNVFPIRQRQRRFKTPYRHWPPPTTPLTIAHRRDFLYDKQRPREQRSDGSARNRQKIGLESAGWVRVGRQNRPRRSIWLGDHSACLQSPAQFRPRIGSCSGLHRHSVQGSYYSSHHMCSFPDSQGQDRKADPTDSIRNPAVGISAPPTLEGKP